MARSVNREHLALPPYAARDQDRPSRRGQAYRKLGSGISKGIDNDKSFNQVTRTVCCIAWAAYPKPVFARFRLLVRRATEGQFSGYVKKEAIEANMKDHATKYAAKYGTRKIKEREHFLTDYFPEFVSDLKIEVISWEIVIERIKAKNAGDGH